MKKLITFLLLFVPVVVTVQAQSAMILNMKDGTRNIVLLQGPESSPMMTPYVTFEGDEIVVHGNHEVRALMSEVQNYVYTGGKSGITTINDAVPTVTFKRDEIVITHQPEGTTTTVYTVGGVLVKSVESHGTSAQIAVDDLPMGVYVVKVGRSTYKFLKR